MKALSEGPSKIVLKTVLQCKTLHIPSMMVKIFSRMSLLHHISSAKNKPGIDRLTLFQKV